MSTKNQVALVHAVAPVVEAREVGKLIAKFVFDMDATETSRKALAIWMDTAFSNFERPWYMLDLKNGKGADVLRVNALVKNPLYAALKVKGHSNPSQVMTEIRNVSQSMLEGGHAGITRDKEGKVIKNEHLDRINAKGEEAVSDSGEASARRDPVDNGLKQLAILHQSYIKWIASDTLSPANKVKLQAAMPSLRAAAKALGGKIVAPKATLRNLEA
jgi:hypothetical protein